MLISAIGQGRGFPGDSEPPWRSATELGLFLDAPWGNIVEDRRGDIRLEYLYPRCGLLGGSGGPGKPSKLAALAKARKEKLEAQKKQQQQQQSLEGGGGTFVSMLSRLSQKQSPPHNAPPTPNPPPPKVLESSIARAPTVALNKPSLSLDQFIRDKPKEQLWEEFVPALDLRAGPSKFAVSMFGDRITSSYEFEVTNARMFSLPGAPLNAQDTAFAGPSPDDVVAAAQNTSKG